ncbi:hypothetical protein BDU57DRAFT_509863 [Ampelomyces quisqualis]|uniref:Cyclin-D1-binding protein 1-like N-terminal domain-containing protein n=1 Tax=Ampelomyces quisqualis TaxID=50730 RepID=A0A6A5R0K3_AMPQU|nr:hypothetical protein BDU57DRAFT_509863 [Ampelomyces quisqualis]
MAKPKDMNALIEVAKTTQSLLTHFQSSLAASEGTPSQPQTTATELPNPLDAIKASTTLLKSHTTTLSLLLLTPPLTPSALVAKINDVNSGALSGMVAAALYVPPRDQKEEIMRTELRLRVRQLVGTWADVLALVLRMAEGGQGAKGKDDGPSASEKQDILSATGVLWEACDALIKLCNDGVVALVVKKATELKATLADAVAELKEWGEDVEDENDEPEDSDDEDDMFAPSNRLGKDDKVLKELLDRSVKKLKLVSILYQALIKRRLKTYPATSASTKAGRSEGANDATSSPGSKLDELMTLLKTIPETVDDLASAFYDLNDDGVKELLEQGCKEAKSAAGVVKQSWAGADDEYTAWSQKWIDAFDAA